MRYYKFVKMSLILFLALVFAAQDSNGQEFKKDKKQEKLAEIERLIESKNFVFIAQRALPSGGRNINLTSTYDLRVFGDTLVSHLPYFGRAFVAPINPSEGGIHFTSTKFSYDVKEKKNGGWDITILPTDTRDVRRMYLSVSEEGYASLQVGSNNRQNIGFNGYITSSKNFK